MNAKKAKFIRRQVRATGLDPTKVEYKLGIPHFYNLLDGVHLAGKMRDRGTQTVISNCGRGTYRTFKKLAAGQRANGLTANIRQS